MYMNPLEEENRHSQEMTKAYNERDNQEKCPICGEWVSRFYHKCEKFKETKHD